MTFLFPDLYLQEIKPIDLNNFFPLPSPASNDLLIKKNHGFKDGLEIKV